MSEQLLTGVKVQKQLNHELAFAQTLNRGFSLLSTSPFFFVGIELDVAAQGKLRYCYYLVDYLPLKANIQSISGTSSTTSVRRCNYDTVNPTLLQNGAGGGINWQTSRGRYLDE